MIGVVDKYLLEYLIVKMFLFKLIFNNIKENLYLFYKREEIIN